MKKQLISLVRKTALWILEKTDPPVSVPYKESIYSIDFEAIKEHINPDLKGIIVKGMGYFVIPKKEIRNPDWVKRMGERTALAIEHNPQLFINK